MHRVAFLVAAVGASALLTAPAQATESNQSSTSQRKFVENLVYRTYLNSDLSDKVEYRDVHWRRHGGAYYGGCYGCGYGSYGYQPYYSGYYPYYSGYYGYRPYRSYYGWGWY